VDYNSVSRIFFTLAAETEGQKTESGMGFLGRRQLPHLHQLGGLEERCELPQLGSELSYDRPKVFHYFQHSG